MTGAWFAHAGHSHEVPASIPWWQDSLTLTVVLLLGFAAMVIAMHLLKARFGLKITLIMVYLLGVGVLGYTIAPAISVVSLTLGFGLAFIITFLQLGAKKQPPQK